MDERGTEVLFLSDADIDKPRHVRTVKGAEFFNLPIGSVITAHMYKAVMAAKEATDHPLGSLGTAEEAAKSLAAYVKNPKATIAPELPSDHPVNNPDHPDHLTAGIVHGVDKLAPHNPSVSGPNTFHILGKQYSVPQGSKLIRPSKFPNIRYAVLPDDTVIAFTPKGQVDVPQDVQDTLAKIANDPGFGDKGNGEFIPQTFDSEKPLSAVEQAVTAQMKQNAAAAKQATASGSAAGAAVGTELLNKQGGTALIKDGINSWSPHGIAGMHVTDEHADALLQSGDVTMKQDAPAAAHNFPAMSAEQMKQFLTEAPKGAVLEAAHAMGANNKVGLLITKKGDNNWSPSNYPGQKLTDDHVALLRKSLTGYAASAAQSDIAAHNKILDKADAQDAAAAGGIEAGAPSASVDEHGAPTAPHPIGHVMTMDEMKALPTGHSVKGKKHPENSFTKQDDGTFKTDKTGNAHAPEDMKAFIDAGNALYAGGPKSSVESSSKKEATNGKTGAAAEGAAHDAGAEGGNGPAGGDAKSGGSGPVSSGAKPEGKSKSEGTGGAGEGVAGSGHPDGGGSGSVLEGDQPSYAFKAKIEQSDAVKALASKYPAVPQVWELDSAKSAGVFHDAISKLKENNPYAASVYVYPEEEYKDMRLFLNKDASAGFALHGDEVVSVFVHSDSTDKGGAVPLMVQAVEQGGKRLDAFDTILPKIYAEAGFVPTARVKWDDNYAPDGWDKTQFGKFNHGEPDVVFMVHDPKSNGQYDPTAGKVFPSYDEASAFNQKAAADPSILNAPKTFDDYAAEVSAMKPGDQVSPNHLATMAPTHVMKTQKGAYVASDGAGGLVHENGTAVSAGNAKVLADSGSLTYDHEKATIGEANHPATAHEIKALAPGSVVGFKSIFSNSVGKYTYEGNDSWTGPTGDKGAVSTEDLLSGKKKLSILHAVEKTKGPGNATIEDAQNLPAGEQMMYHAPSGMNIPVTKYTTGAWVVEPSGGHGSVHLSSEKVGQLAADGYLSKIEKHTSGEFAAGPLVTESNAAFHGKFGQTYYGTIGGNQYEFTKANGAGWNKINVKTSESTPISASVLSIHIGNGLIHEAEPTAGKDPIAEAAANEPPVGVSPEELDHYPIGMAVKLDDGGVYARASMSLWKKQSGPGSPYRAHETMLDYADQGAVSEVLTADKSGVPVTPEWLAQAKAGAEVSDGHDTYISVGGGLWKTNEPGGAVNSAAILGLIPGLTVTKDNDAIESNAPVAHAVGDKLTGADIAALPVGATVTTGSGIIYKKLSENLFENTASGNVNGIAVVKKVADNPNPTAGHPGIFFHSSPGMAAPQEAAPYFEFGDTVHNADVPKLAIGDQLSYTTANGTNHWLYTKTAEGTFTDDAGGVVPEGSLKTFANSGNLTYVGKAPETKAPTAEEAVAQDENAPSVQLVDGGSLFSKAAVTEAITALQNKGGFQPKYAFKDVPNNPLGKDDTLPGIMAAATAAYPDLKVKPATIAYLQSKIGIEPTTVPKVAEHAPGTKLITLGADVPAAGVQGFDGGKFTHEEIQAAIDALESNKGKLSKSILNNAGSPLGKLDPNKIVGFDKDKTVVKANLIQHLKDKLAANPITESTSELTPEPEVEVAPVANDGGIVLKVQSAEDGKAYLNALAVGSIVVESGGGESWEKQADGKWMDDAGVLRDPGFIHNKVVIGGYAHGPDHKEYKAFPAAQAAAAPAAGKTETPGAQFNVSDVPDLSGYAIGQTLSSGISTWTHVGGDVWKNDLTGIEADPAKLKHLLGMTDGPWTWNGAAAPAHPVDSFFNNLLNPPKSPSGYTKGDHLDPVTDLPKLVPGDQFKLNENGKSILVVQADHTYKNTVSGTSFQDESLSGLKNLTFLGHEDLPAPTPKTGFVTPADTLTPSEGMKLWVKSDPHDTNPIQFFFNASTQHWENPAAANDWISKTPFQSLVSKNLVTWDKPTGSTPAPGASAPLSYGDEFHFEKLTTLQPGDLFKLQGSSAIYEVNPDGVTASHAGEPPVDLAHMGQMTSVYEYMGHDGGVPVTPFPVANDPNTPLNTVLPVPMSASDVSKMKSGEQVEVHYPDGSKSTLTYKPNNPGYQFTDENGIGWPTEDVLNTAHNGELYKVAPSTPVYATAPPAVQLSAVSPLEAADFKAENAKLAPDGFVLVATDGTKYYTAEHKDGSTLKQWSATTSDGKYTGTISHGALVQMLKDGKVTPYVTKGATESPYGVKPGKYYSGGKAYMVVKEDGTGVYVPGTGNSVALNAAQIKKNYDAGVNQFAGIPGKLPPIKKAAPAAGKAPTVDDLPDGKYFVGNPLTGKATIYTVSGDKAEVVKPLTKEGWKVGGKPSNQWIAEAVPGATIRANYTPYIKPENKQMKGLTLTFGDDHLWHDKADATWTTEELQKDYYSGGWGVNPVYSSHDWKIVSHGLGKPDTVDKTKLKTAFIGGKLVDQYGNSALPKGHTGSAQLFGVATTVPALLDAKQFLEANPNGAAGMKKKLGELGVGYDDALAIKYRDDNGFDKSAEGITKMLLHAITSLTAGAEVKAPTNEESTAADLFVFNKVDQAQLPLALAAQNPSYMGASEQNAYIKAASKAFGDGKIIGQGISGADSWTKSKWVTAFSQGDFATMYKYEVQALADKNKVHPTGYLHPGYSENAATNKIQWASPVAGETPAGQTVPGQWSSVSLLIPKEEVENYLLAANMQNPRYLSLNERREWVKAHRIGGIAEVQILSATAALRKQNGEAYVSDPISWHDNIQPAKAYDYMFESEKFPTDQNSWYSHGAVEYLQDHPDPVLQQKLEEKAKDTYGYSTFAQMPNSYQQSMAASVLAEHFAQLKAVEDAKKLIPVYTKDPVQSVKASTNPVYTYHDQFGQKYFFKPRAASKLDRYRSEVEHYGNQFGRLFGFKTPDSKVVTLDGAYGQLQTDSGGPGDLEGVALSSLTADQVADIGKEHVLDWFLGNDDSKRDNMRVLDSGHIAGIDKGRAFKHYGGWNGLSADSSMDTNCHTVYSQLYDEIRSGSISKEKVDKAYIAVHRQAARMSKVSDDTIRDYLSKAMANREMYDNSYTINGKTVPNTYAGLEAAVLDRKSKLPAEIDAMWNKIYQQAGYGELPAIPNKPLGEQVHSGLDEGDLHEQVLKVRTTGVSTHLGGGDFTGGSAVLWKALGDDTGTFHIRGEAHVMPKKQKELLGYMIANSGVASATKSNANGLATFDIFGTQFTSLAKTINHHIKDGTEPNPVKVTEYNGAKNVLEKDRQYYKPDLTGDVNNGEAVLFPSGAKIPVDQVDQYKLMLDHYAKYIPALENGLNTKTKVDTVEAYEPIALADPPAVYTNGSSKLTLLANGQAILNDGTGSLVMHPAGSPVVKAAKSGAHDWVPLAAHKPNEAASYLTIHVGPTHETFAKMDANGDIKYGTQHIPEPQHKTAGYTGQDYEVSLPTGEKIWWRDSEQTGTLKGQSGRLQFQLSNVKGEDDIAASMARVQDAMREMGLNVDAAEPADAERDYWRQMSEYILRRNHTVGSNYAKMANELIAKRTDLGGSKSEFLENLSNSFNSTEEENQYWRDIFGKYFGADKVEKLIDTEAYMPQYDHTDSANPEMLTGKPYWTRFDISKEDIRKQNKFLVSTTSEGGGDTSKLAMTKSGAALSTEERLRVYGTNAYSGWSSGTDQENHGSGHYIYTRVGDLAQFKSGSYDVLYDPALMLRLGTASFGYDAYGDQDALETAANSDPLHALKSFDAEGDSNETVLPHSASLLDGVEMMWFGNATQRNEAIQFLKAHGITEIRGIPVEERLVMKGSKSTMDSTLAKVKKQWQKQN